MSSEEKKPPDAPPPAPPPAPRGDRLVVAACGLGLLGLTVSLLHLLRPNPLFFALFMTVGQGSMLAAVVLFAFTVVQDLRRRGVL